MRSAVRTFVATGLIVFLAIGGRQAAAASQDDFRKQVETLYAFSPATLDSAGLDKKSAELDAFWKMVEGAPAQYLPLLRTELARDGNSPFFYYDGSQLLLSLSDSDSDKRLALTAVPRTDIRDLDPIYYLRSVHKLAVEGFDTSDAAFRVLDYPKLRVFIVQHALTLSQDYIFVYLLLPTKEKYYLPKLLERVKAEDDPVALKSLLRMLWYADTDEADAAIAWASGAERLPSDIRKAAAAMVDARNRARASAGTASPGGYAALRERRRKRMRSISDEALLDLDKMTLRMKAMRP